MSKPTEYRCHAKIVALLEQTKLSLAALRLVHACYHCVDQTPYLRLEMMELPGDRSCRVRCTEVMAAVGTRGANDNRMIHQAIRDLEGRGIFHTLKLDVAAQVLIFQFSKTFVKAGRQNKGDRFAMIDTEVVSALRSPAHVLFYSRAAMVDRMKYPNFILPAFDEDGPGWVETKRSWLRAAARVGEIMGHDYLFVPQLDAFRKRVVLVRVKVDTGRSIWSAGKLYPRLSVEPVSIAAGGTTRTLPAKELRQRREWRRVLTAA